MNNTFIEQACCIQHEGKSFCAGGAMHDDDRLIAYIDSNPNRERVGETGPLTDWHGNRIGIYQITSIWPIPNGWVSGIMCQFRLTLTDGRRYTGRGSGHGMVVKAKRIKGDKQA